MLVKPFGSAVGPGELEGYPRRCTRASRRLDTGVRTGCALLVAGVAAYSSYVHQRGFARQGGADAATAALWPLSVDGLLLLAAVGLLRLPKWAGRRERYVVWAAFLLGIAVSLAANIAAARTLTWRPVLVAGWPPVALLLSVELMIHRSTGAQPAVDTDEPEEAVDPLLPRAAAADAHHRELHERPISAESLRKELRIGAARSRKLIALIRARGNGLAPAAGTHASTRE